MHDGATCEEPEPTSLYRIGGLHVSSIEAPDDPLFEQVHSDAPDIVIRRGRREDADLAWHAAADPVRYGDVLVAASPEGGYVVKYPEWFVAVVGPQGREIVVFEEDRWSGLSRSLFATVVPLALAATGRVAFHASAVDVDGAAVVIVGEGGAGKSTLATALCLEGGRLIADDITYVRLDADGTVVAEPSGGATRLFPAVAARMGRGSVDPLADKQLLGRPFVTSASSSSVLAAVEVLVGPEGDGRTVTRPVRGADAVIVLLRYMLAAPGRLQSGQTLQHRIAVGVAGRAQVRRRAWQPDASLARVTASRLIDELANRSP